MPMSCKICNHSDRLSIDREIVQGKNRSAIARKYGLTHDNIDYHAKNHITRQLATAMQRKETAESFDLLDKIETILSRTERIFKRNYDKEKDGLALKALSESRSTIELLAKIAAYMHEARAAELQASQGDIDSKFAEAQAMAVEQVFDRLTEPETDMFLRLVAKASGETDEIIIYGPSNPPSFASDTPYQSADEPFYPSARSSKSHKQQPLTKSQLKADKELDQRASKARQFLKSYDKGGTMTWTRTLTSILAR